MKLLSKEHGPAYRTEGPISAETDWLVFPFDVQVEAKSYRAAVQRTREVLEEAERLFTAGEAQPCTLSLLDFDSTYKKYRATIELHQSGSDLYQASIRQYAVLKFDAKGAFWEKSQIIAEVLDKLNDLERRHKADKAVTVELKDRKPEVKPDL